MQMLSTHSHTNIREVFAPNPAGALGIALDQRSTFLLLVMMMMMMMLQKDDCIDNDVIEITFHCIMRQRIIDVVASSIFVRRLWDCARLRFRAGNQKVIKYEFHPSTLC